MAKEKDWYSEIDKVIKEYENYKPYHTRNLDWAADRIDWCWKWRKISKEQMEELADRVSTIYEQGL